MKTRLASTVGDEQALKIYQALLGHTREIAESLPVDRLLFYSNYIEQKDDWPESHFKKSLQSSGDLGTRITAAFEQASAVYEKVIIIGSDCASLTTAIVDSAFEALDTHDFVLGPALDGGYYLLGMKGFEASVFADIAWSTETVADQTRARITSLDKTCHELPTLSDIDYEEDWLKYGWEIK